MLGMLHEQGCWPYPYLLLGATPTRGLCCLHDPDTGHHWLDQGRELVVEVNLFHPLLWGTWASRQLTPCNELSSSGTLDEPRQLASFGTPLAEGALTLGEKAP